MEGTTITPSQMLVRKRNEISAIYTWFCDLNTRDQEVDSSFPRHPLRNPSPLVRPTYHQNQLFPGVHTLGGRT